MNPYELRDRLRSALLIPIGAWLFHWLTEGSREATRMLPYTTGAAIVLMSMFAFGRLVESVTADAPRSTSRTTGRFTRLLPYLVIAVSVVLMGGHLLWCTVAGGSTTVPMPSCGSASNRNLIDLPTTDVVTHTERAGTRPDPIHVSLNK